MPIPPWVGSFRGRGAGPRVRRSAGFQRFSPHEDRSSTFFQRTSRIVHRLRTVCIDLVLIPHESLATEGAPVHPSTLWTRRKIVTTPEIFSRDKQLVNAQPLTTSHSGAATEPAGMSFGEIWRHAAKYGEIAFSRWCRALNSKGFGSRLGEIWRNTANFGLGVPHRCAEKPSDFSHV